MNILFATHIHMNVYIYVLFLEKEVPERKYQNDLATSMYSHQNIVEIKYARYF